MFGFSKNSSDKKPAEKTSSEKTIELQIFDKPIDMSCFSGG